jgi:chlorobactene glucosyltransferase
MISWLWNIYFWGCALLLLLVLVTLLLNLRLIPQLREASPPEHAPFISVLVPARNEESRIVSCLQSLSAQRYPRYEVIVLDDQSEDRTREMIESLGFSPTGSRLRLIDGQPLPPDWTGKPWACHQLGRVARGEFLLFTDADTIHAPGTLAAVACLLQKSDADLLTLWPYQITGTLAEKLVIPLLFVVAGGFLPQWFLSLCQRSNFIGRVVPPSWLRRLGAASGQFICFRRSAYDAIRGHEGVADDLVEDVGLARRIAERTGAGMRLITGDGTRLVRCRMYRSLEEMWEGFTKNLRPLFEHDGLGFWIAVIFQALTFVLPFLLIIIAPGPQLLFLVALVLAIRMIAAIRFRTSWLSVALHPLGYALALSMAMNSFRRARGNGVSWKGRLYQVHGGSGRRVADSR